jgi:hypothetical protein
MISIISPTRVWLDLLSTLVLTLYIFVVFFRGRPRLRDRRRRIEVVSAPNFACGVGPPQDASASVLL